MGNYNEGRADPNPYKSSNSFKSSIPKNLLRTLNSCTWSPANEKMVPLFFNAIIPKYSIVNWRDKSWKMVKSWDKTMHKNKNFRWQCQNFTNVLTWIFIFVFLHYLPRKMSSIDSVYLHSRIPCVFERLFLLLGVRPDFSNKKWENNGIKIYHLLFIPVGNG